MLARVEVLAGELERRSKMNHDSCAGAAGEFKCCSVRVGCRSGQPYSQCLLSRRRSGSPIFGLEYIVIVELMDTGHFPITHLKFRQTSLQRLANIQARSLRRVEFGAWVSMHY